MKTGIRKAEVLGHGLAYLALSWLYLRMTPAKFVQAVGPDLGDPLFTLSILRWGADRAAHGFADFWNPTFFHPLRGVLALSDHLAGPSVVAALLAAVGFTPAAVYNGILLLAFAGSALAAHWVFRRSGLTRAGASFGAIAWSFSCFRWSSLSHLQILLAIFVPLTLWTIDRFLERPGGRTALAFSLSYAGHVAGGAYLAYMIHLPLAVVAAVRLRTSWRTLLNRRALLWVGLVLVLSALLVAALFSPYLDLGKSMGLRPTMGELAKNMVTLSSYVSVGARALYAPLLSVDRAPGYSLWLGLLPLAMAGFGLFRFLKTRLDPDQRDWAAGFACGGVALLALLASDLQFEWGGLLGRETLRSLRWTFRSTIAVVLLSLFLVFRLWRSRRAGGRRVPEDRWWWGLLLAGLACLLISHVSFFSTLRPHLPGMEAIRLPGRFLVFASFAISAFAGRGFDRVAELVRPWGRRGAWLAAAIFALLLVELTPRARYLRWTPVSSESNLPAVYRWVRDTAEIGAIVELPMLKYWREAERMYYWSIHRRPIVNGYSGYLPKRYTELREQLLDFPSAAVARRLGEIGVTHIVIHLDQLSRADRRRWREWHAALEAAENPPMSRVLEEGEAMVYRIGVTSGPKP